MLVGVGVVDGAETRSTTWSGQGVCLTVDMFVGHARGEEWCT